jgi:hypothetical protein
VASREVRTGLRHWQKTARARRPSSWGWSTYCMISPTSRCQRNRFARMYDCGVSHGSLTVFKVSIYRSSTMAYPLIYR